jgi:hypothetical protein
MALSNYQRGTAATDGWISEQVIIARAHPTPGSQRAMYAVRVYVKDNDSHVEITPEPPSVQERKMAMIEARQLLQQREQDPTAPVSDHQVLTRAITNLTLEIDALP